MVDVAFTVGLNGLEQVQRGFQGIQTSLNQVQTVARRSGTGLVKFGQAVANSGNGLATIAGRVSEVGRSLGLVAASANKSGGIISTSMATSAESIGRMVLGASNLALAVIPLTFALSGLTRAAIAIIGPWRAFTALLIAKDLPGALKLFSKSWVLVASATALAALATAEYTGTLDRLLEKLQSLNIFGSIGAALEQFGGGLNEVEKDVSELTEVWAAHTKVIAAAGLSLQQFTNLVSTGFAEAITPQEIYAAKVAELKQKHDEGRISAEGYALGLREAGKAAQDSAIQTAQGWIGIAGTVGDAFGTLFKENKAVAIAQAIINTAEAITQAMKLPPPLDVVKIAAVTALGAAQIATIASTSVGKQIGGIIPGSGTGDKVRALLEPGEFVVNRNAARANHRLLEQINSDSPRFQMGGSVGGRNSGGAGDTFNVNVSGTNIWDDNGLDALERRMKKVSRRRRGA